MGDLIHIHELRARRTRTAAGGLSPECHFHFDLASPWSYFAAERVERLFARVHWVPTWSARLAPVLPGDPLAVAGMQNLAERRAAVLRLGLVWPDRWPAAAPAAMRAAEHAVESGRGAAFALAAGRLAFGGGFDLDDPEVLAEAAAAAGLDVDRTVRASANASYDAPIAAAGRRLLAAGVDRLPAVRVDGAHFGGEERLEEAAGRGAPHVRQDPGSG